MTAKPDPEPAELASMDRRAAIQRMLTVAAAIAVLDPVVFSAEETSARPARGYGTDPDLTKTYRPGELWPLTFTPEQRSTAAALCDAIIPADANGPAASSVGVPAFIDEWISAPYPGHAEDRRLILTGLAWLEAESQTRFGADFVNLVLRQKAVICDDIYQISKAKPEHLAGAKFFRRFRDLTAGGYYSTPEGMKDIGYVGNIPLATFDGPPREVLVKLGLA